MAEFALGLTKTAVAATVSRVKSAMEEEAKLRVLVQNDLVFITGEFEMMQSFLSASTTGERASKNLVVRTWVRQLRDLAFDVEDCVEFVVHMDKASRWDWVGRMVSSVMVCMTRPPLPLDVAVGEIKRLKARVEYVSQRNSRYNLIGGGDDTPADDVGDHQHGKSSNVAAAAAAGAGAFQVLKDVWKAAGKLGDHTAVDLNRLISSDVSELQVITLWCGGGASEFGDDGHTSPNDYALTMMKAYDDPEISRRFKNRAWVKLSAHHPFNPVEFVNSLLTQFRSRHGHLEEDNNQHHHHSYADGNSGTIYELLLQLRQHRYLVVIEEELTTGADWDAIRTFLPDGNNGSRVVVSTNNLGIALACTGDPYKVSALKSFSHDRGLYAFRKDCARCMSSGELVLLFRQSGVFSLFWETPEERAQFREKWSEDHMSMVVVDEGEFEEYIWHDCQRRDSEKLKVYDVARSILIGSYGAAVFYREVGQMSEEVLIEMCRKILTEHNYLIFIWELQSVEEWDLIKQQLLCESTRSCIVVLTQGKQSLTTHCVDHDESRVFNVRYLDIKRYDEQVHFGEEVGSIKKGAKCELVGRESEVELCCLDGRYPDKRVSLWGMTGVGKTAMAREMYNNNNMCKDDFSMHGWVEVPNPFDLTDVCRRLLLDFYSEDVAAKESVAIGMMEGHDPIQWCCKILRQNKCLLVLDGLRSMHDWGLVKATLLSQPVKGTTIVTTRLESIAADFPRATCDIHNVKCLEDDVALKLFEKIACKYRDSPLPEAEMEIVRVIMSKCGGLPGVIAAIGELCCDGHGVIMGTLENVNAKFMGLLEDREDLRGLFSWMQSYFDTFSDDVKPCIFYMSVFQTNQCIRPRRMLRRWIAEGYISGGGGGTVDEKGENLLRELMELNIYKGQKKSSVRSLKINGFFCEYIKSRPMEDNQVFALEGSFTPSRLTGQHLTISSSWDRDKNVFNMIDLSRLRSLTVFGLWKSFILSDKMRVLRVLDLEGTSSEDTTSCCVTDDDLEYIAKWLGRLKFLSLRGCKRITRLPDSLGDTRQLQTLDVRYTSIVELPAAIITKLHKLQYVRAGTSTDTSPYIVPAAVAPAPAPSATATATPPRDQVCHGDMATTAAAAAASVVQGASAMITEAWKRKASDLVESCRCRSSSWWWQFKTQLDVRRRRRVAANGGGVEVGLAAADGIGRLTHLHTLGVVNVARGGKTGALVFLVELKKLTQLRKLGLSGINRENWGRLWEAISGNLPHLESLSLQLMLLEEDAGSYQFACFHNIPDLTKTLKRLKVLYTTTGVRPRDAAQIDQAWIWKLRIERFVHELTLSSQEDIHSIQHGFGGVTRLRIKPVEEDLSFEEPDRSPFKPINGKPLESLRIECPGTFSKSKITLGKLITFEINEINIHCCCTSSAAGSSSCGLQIAGLDQVWHLNQVTVTGTYADALKTMLQLSTDVHIRVG